MLTTGNRLDLLRQAWGSFPINQDLANAIAAAHKSATGTEKDLHYTTVFRWADRDGKPRDFDLHQVAEGLAEYADQKGLLERYSVTGTEFVENFSTEDDVVFVKFIARAADRRLPVPEGVRKMDESKVKEIIQDLKGRFEMYRLGHDVIRKGVLIKGTRPLLRKIPAEILNDSHEVTYREAYRDADNEYSAQGWVFKTKNLISIFGEDAERTERSELFFAFIDPEQINKPFFEGVISMKGDLEVPTSYRIVLKPAAKEDQGLDWDEFVKKNSRTIPLTDDLQLKKPNDIKDMPFFEKIIDLLRITDSDVDLVL